MNHLFKRMYLLSALPFLLVLLIPIIAPLLSPGYFPMHDDTQVARTVVMGKALLNGQFPVRWVDDLGYGYGYPLFNFYGPLPYYISGLLYAVGLSGLLATKVMMAIGMLGAPIVFYCVFVHLLGRKRAVIGSMIYAYAPYHATQLYVRGSIGELWILVFLPLLVYAVIETLQTKNYAKSILLGSIGLTGMIVSHTLLGFASVVLYAIALVCIFLWNSIRKQSLERTGIFAIVFVVALGLTAWFWLPAVTEMGVTGVSGQVGPSAYFREHFVCISQLFSSPWGYGGSAPGCIDGMSFAFGKVHLVLLLLGLIGTWVTRDKRVRIVGLFGIGIILISIFLMLDISSFLWSLLPGFLYIQYPWRFLAFTTIGLAMVGSFCTMMVRSEFVARVMGIIILVCIIVGTRERFHPQYIYPQSPLAFETETELRYRASKVSDEYLPPSIPRPEREQDYIHQTVPDSSQYMKKTVTERETYKKYEFLSSGEATVLLSHAHFPGWIYKVNGVVQEVHLDKGRPLITIPNDFSTLEMIFTDTPVRKLGNTLSFIVVVVLVYVYGKKTVA